MKFSQLWKPVLMALATIFISFVATSIFDIILAVMHPRFYSNAAFIAIFGVAGIFAALLAYEYGKKTASGQSDKLRWALIITSIVTALVFYFVLAEIEGGEYEWACKAFGIALALATVFFARTKITD